MAQNDPEYQQFLAFRAMRAAAAAPVVAAPVPVAALPAAPVPVAALPAAPVPVAAPPAAPADFDRSRVLPPALYSNVPVVQDPVIRPPTAPRPDFQPVIDSSVGDGGGGYLVPVLPMGQQSSGVAAFGGAFNGMCSGTPEFTAQFMNDLVQRSAPAGGLNWPKTTDVRSTMVRCDSNGKQMMWRAEGDASQMGGLAESFLGNKRKAEDEIDPAAFSAVVKENVDLRAEIVKLTQTNSRLKAALAAYAQQ